MSSRSLPSCGRARYALSFSTAALLAKETCMSYFKNLAKAIFAIDNLPPEEDKQSTLILRDALFFADTVTIDGYDILETPVTYPYQSGFFTIHGPNK